MSAPATESVPPTDPDDVLDQRIVRLELGVACLTFVTATLSRRAASPRLAGGPSLSWHWGGVSSPPPRTAAVSVAISCIPPPSSP
ncbi:hypothetical protein [Haloplanus ruber]|uniref:hypothetical protein n=1 Tax=Haloplanus ruber TaxID=869892 RepID=UPI0036D305A8